MAAIVPASTQLWDLLVDLLLTDSVTEAMVASRLKPFITASHNEPERVGRTFFVAEGPYFTLTATFEKPSSTLYQVTLRLRKHAFTQLRAYAQYGLATPTTAVKWYTSWFSLWSKVVVTKPAKGPQKVVGLFMGLVPKQKFIILTRS